MRKRLCRNLSNTLSSEVRGNIYNSFDVVGNIAIIKMFHASRVSEETAEVIMNRHRNIKTVLLQISPVSGALRLRSLAYVAGEKNPHNPQGIQLLFLC